VTISSSGLFTRSTKYTQTASTTLVNGTLTATGSAIVNIQGGTLGGTGTINGNVLMAGTMMPGDAPGTLAIFGNYEQAGSGMFDELMSPSASFLNVNGNVLLDPDAFLEITLIGGFDPLGQTFTLKPGDSGAAAHTGRLVTAIIIYLTANFLLTLLMVLKRVHLMLMEKLDRQSSSSLRKAS